MRILVDLFELTRPVNVLITIITIALAAYITTVFEPLGNIVLACISGALITMGANAINDFFDVEIDRINRPGRPIPSNRVTKAQALVFSIVTLVLGVGTSLFIHKQAFIICTAAALLVFLYSWRLKKTPFWGNFVVSLTTAFAFVYGSVAVNRIEDGLYPAGFAFFMHLGREIVKDMQDIEGDRAHLAQTIPIKYGKKFAQWLVTVVLVCLIVFTLIPYFTGHYGIWFLIIVVLGVHTVLIYALILLWDSPTRKVLGKISTLIKLDMIAGLVAILAGRW